MEIREIYLNIAVDHALVSSFYQMQAIDLPADLDYLAGCFDGGRLVALGGVGGKVIKGLAVAGHRRGENITAALLTHLIACQRTRGITNSFIFSTAANDVVFRGLGFSKIAGCGAKLSLFEHDSQALNNYLNYLRSAKIDHPKIAAIVMNANPMTLGHAFLIEQTRRLAGHTFVFMVEEDRAQFPFTARAAIVRQFCSDFADVTVLNGGDYIISAATFPTYFTKDKNEAAGLFPCLDANLFGRHIAPALAISLRCVGEEPFDQTTRCYNQALHKRLPDFGVAVREIGRKTQDGQVISASRVRYLLRRGKREQAEKLLPPASRQFLAGEQGERIVADLIAAARMEDYE